jgi:hypothetical protein
VNHLILSSQKLKLQCQTQNFITVGFFSLHRCAALRCTCSAAGITNFLNHSHYMYKNWTAVKRHTVYMNSLVSTSGKILPRATNCHSYYYRQLNASQSTFQTIIFRFDTVQSCSTGGYAAYTYRLKNLVHIWQWTFKCGLSPSTMKMEVYITLIQAYSAFCVVQITWN